MVAKGLFEGLHSLPNLQYSIKKTCYYLLQMTDPAVLIENILPLIQVDLSIDQKQVIVALVDWIHQRKKEFITVGGYAGTGKTTLIAVLRLALKLLFPHRRVAFACYTGKASQVLQQKLQTQNALFPQDFCGTIHSLLYTAVLDEQGKILHWRRNQQLDFDLLIIDEASMITADIWHDLTVFGLPLVVVGDHGQLPPIQNTAGTQTFNLMAQPELKLEVIHRQAEHNPILHIAQLARDEGKIPFKKFSSHVMKLSRDSEEASEIFERIAAQRDEEVLILCARNKTRILLNKQVRSLRGYESEQPQVGETVICLKNNYDAEGGAIYNGMVGTLDAIKNKDAHWYDVELRFQDTQRMFRGEISRHQFHQEKFIEKVEGLPYARIGNRFDFGYALTVHKAQGSQAKTVVLFEEFMPYADEDEHRRWLYTAVTRATDQLYIFG
jgi:exodeoxyribonuclease-5